ncbi:6-hydroxymethylpterin diphosphokinase MptE-like protein [Ichthyenterobacterium sp. W332]|uniref:6-hydroxymethylpterin diphosphokinase MptE-like protein n=1 Tax=Microcosmobacter mediterraneus TaxID=3075607 RepID=A0ABU2YIR3_9FLAO|nr:6-hydroxymethylpterin diphosphokinase MptE-like protein [Ichthyenterobacterium sp. W332]MDT0558064.1 6-hydroxymethylpterin diphosphokinase MptE-like protein [Ichthyenterobacterium sp. W332]
MKEKILDLIRISTYYPRKILDFFLYYLYLKQKNNWDILSPFFNKPILVVGNGPSLNKTPLDKLYDSFVSIGMNKINLIYEKSSWRPQIITCVNGLVIKQNKEYFNTTERILIVPVKALYLGIKPRKNVLFVQLKDKEIMRSNIKKGVSTGCTVTFTALQIAAYLNPKSVNIVGVDHSFVVKRGTNYEIKKFEGDDVNHFSKDYFKNQYWGVPDLHGSEKLYLLSKNHFDQRNIPVCDYTIDGKLEIFRKGKIEQLISDDIIV